MSREYWTGNVTRLITVTFSKQTALPGSSKVMDSHHSQTTEQDDDPPQTNQEHKGIQSHDPIHLWHTLIKSGVTSQPPHSKTNHQWWTYIPPRSNMPSNSEKWKP